MKSTIHTQKPHTANPHAGFKKVAAMLLITMAVAAYSAQAEEYSFFKYGEQSSLNGYASYDEWCAVAGIGKSSSSASAETISEAGHRTWAVSSGINLLTKMLKGFLISVQ